MLTGLDPHEHGVERAREAVRGRVELLPESLAELGYRSAGVVSTVPFLSRSHGLAQGWAVYDDQTAFPPPADRPGRLLSSPTFVSSPLVHRRAVELLDELAPGPFFLFVHFFDAHADYLPPPPFDRLVASGPEPPLDLAGAGAEERAEAAERARRYDGEIRWVDHWVGRLLDELERRGLAARTVVLLTADHGEEFLEHGSWEHHVNAFDTSLRVPLVLRLPDRRHAGLRCGATVGLVDVAPTLLALAGRSGPPIGSGRDLLEPVRAGCPADPRELLLRTERDNRSKRFLVGIVRGGHKAIFAASDDGRSAAGAEGLFEIDRDRFERHDLRAARPELVEELRERVERRLAAARGRRRALEESPETRLGEEEEESLRALGYL